METLQLCISSGKGQTPSMLLDTMNMVNRQTEKDYGHVLYGPGWEKLKRCFDFTNGKRVVLTNMLGNDLRVLVFGDDGYEINPENLSRTKVILDTAVMKETQKEIEWYDLVDSERFSINEYDAMLEDLGIKDGSILFSRFRIPGKSLDEGLVPLMSNQDVLSLLEYVPIYKEIKVYAKKNMMEVVLGTGKGVVVEELTEDDKIKTEPLTPPWSFESLSDSDISDHPPWSSESMNEKKNKRLSEEFQFRKLLFDIDLKFGLNFSHETIEMKNEVKAEEEMEEPDPNHGEDEAEENAKLFDELDHLLKHVPFLKETVVIIDVDAPLLAVDAQVVPLVIDLEEQLERPKKRRKLNPA
ncbi:hypothetical protein Tco_1110310 [Tanacetum coccineum]|uniref:Uncharacterized protein n=1 Tax=Tanacetum coccineum TaxID=301880 RepID=A0ABQ5IKV3_9ASTR